MMSRLPTTLAQDAGNAPGPDNGSQRNRILGIAAKLFAEHGYHAISMRDLCDAVGLGRGAVYYHIKSKEDLLYDIAKEYIQDLGDIGSEQARRELDPNLRIAILGRLLVEKIASHQTQLTVCFREVQSLSEPRYSEVMELHSRYEKIWRDTLIDGADQGYFRPYDPIVLKGILGMYFYSYIWMRPQGKLSTKHIAERLNNLALRMLSRDEPALPTDTPPASVGRTYAGTLFGNGTAAE